MKTQTTSFCTTIGEKHLADLTSLVQETLATGMNLIPRKSFNNVNLWKIQRNKKKVAVRNFMARI